MLNRILLAFLFSFSFSADLFISEVAEGSSNNKYIEIFNAGDNGVDLSAYSLSSCSNGCDVDGEWDYPDNVTFEATVAPGDVYVVCHQSADETILAECDQTFTYLSNGDDLFALTEIAGGGVVDMVGDYGDDPGSGWAVCGVADATKDHTLVRKSSVMAGNSGNWGASAGTDSEDCEWIVLDQNTWDGVGFHEMDSSAMTYIVEAGGYYYAPQTLTIDMGDTVVWENVSGFHDVVSYDGLFSLDACSGPCTIGEITFNNPGEFDYFCSVGNHEQQGMVGTIIVLGEIQLDCTDEAACNFAEPGDCVYPEENYDCDGNCVVETDCSGECGGDAVVDECGECGGNGSSCAELVNLFYSEWAEGSSNNKYIEIFNPSTSDVSLGAYAMGTVGNAPDVPGEYEYWNTFDEGATVSAGDVFVVCHPDADPVIQEECDMTFTYLSNGDDGNCLVFGTESNYTILDCIGDWEADPGNGWAVAGIADATKDHTIVRKPSTEMGAGYSWVDSAGSNEDDSQWVVFEQNNWDDVGFHLFGDIIITCDDEAACNFGEESSCEYPEENYDCDGNCTAEEDECGECGGDGSSCAEAANLFFSEAAEGSSNNKYLEIFNADDVEVDLSSYSLSSCSNGCDAVGEWDYPNNVTFETGDAILQPGDVYVVCHGSSDEYILAECDQTFTYLSNGDDVFALTQISTGNVLDVIGLVGEDPGTGWDVAGVSNATKDHTLVRKAEVTSGNPLWLDNPDTGEQGSAGDDAEDSEWIVLDVDTWDNLGYHDFDGEDGGAPACVQDCPYFDELDGENDYSPDEFCTILVSWGDDSCIDDCAGEDAIEVNDYITQCEDCLTNNDCEDLFDDDSDCDVDGDVNGDDILNVLDVVQIVSAITSSTTDDLNCADMNGDDLINVLDIVQVVGIITGGRAFDANSASLEVNDFNVILKSNGYIGGVQMKLEHGSNFELNLNSNSMVADYMNHGNYSIVVIVEPKDEILFTTNSKFEIADILIANSEEEIQLNMVNDFSLSGAYPNPFNPSTSFNINIPSSGYLSVKVFNISGQLVDVIASGVYSPNSYDFTWNANNMATGMYVINAEFEGKNISHNVSLIK